MAALADQDTPPPDLLQYNGDLQELTSGASDSEYGTFEVSMIEVDADYDAPASRKTASSLCERVCSMCSEECLFVLLLLSTPFQLQTYKTLVFHAVNFAFAVLAVGCTVLLHVLKLPLYTVASWSVQFRSVEMWSLHQLLCADCALFNFIAPVGERVRVYGTSIDMQSEGGLYGMYAQLYFGGVKLLCTGFPGVIAAMMFLWSLQNVATLVIQRGDGSASATSSTNGHSLSTNHELDMMTIVAAIAVYGCVLLLHVFAFISRQFTIFFCSQYLLYASAN